MSKETLLVNYACVSAFKRAFYGKVLLREHVNGGMVNFSAGSIKFPDGETSDRPFWGYVLEKAGVKYFLETVDTETGDRIEIRKVLPVFPEGLIPFGYRDNVYELITKPKPAILKPNKRMSFKQLVDKISCLPHTNPEHIKMLWFVVLTQMMDRANFRVSTPPGTGKDSVVDIIGNLVGNAATIVRPTPAKLEYRTTYKLLVINEIVGLPKADWELIEQFILDVAAFKPEVEKRSRAFDKSMEVLNVSDFSLGVFYNDVDTYGNDEVEYVDDTAKGAVLDRLPALRLYGTYSHDFNEIQGINIDDFVKENFDTYRSLVSTFTYYKELLFNIPLKWEMSIPTHIPGNQLKFPERWRINCEKLLRVIQLYSESEEEYRNWEKVLWGAMEDYQDMLTYHREFPKVKEKLSRKELHDLRQGMKKLNTFKQKITKLRRNSNETPDYAGLTQWQTT
jgi:hypothetical protein